MFLLLLESAKKYFREEQVELIYKAYNYASLKHEGVFRDSGEPYITHPVYVAYILLEEMHLHDVPAIIGALLHDVIEDTPTTYQDIKKEFGEEVANLVLGVTKIKDLNFTSKSKLEQYNTCLLLYKSINDYRIVLIKLADRLHNMRTLEYKKDIYKENKREAKSLETLQLFVPLAERIGTYLVKSELEDMAFKYLYPKDFEYFRAMKDDYLEKYVDLIDEIRSKMLDILIQQGIDCEIRIRYKNLYSLFRELQVKQKMATVHDLILYQVTVKEVNDCYKVLGYIHKYYPNITGYFRDYLFTPKPNGYRNLHTTVCGFKSLDGIREHFVQFQICTKKMALVNNYGFAVLQELYPDKSIREIQDYLAHSSVIASLEDIRNLYKKDDEFIKHVYEEILGEQIQVYSRDGYVYSLPKGSTVLDFAYKVHSEVGDTADYAIINGVNVPIDFVLHDGDRIQVVTNPNKKYQTEDALKYVSTALARRKIKEGLKNN